MCRGESGPSCSSARKPLTQKCTHSLYAKLQRHQEPGAWGARGCQAKTVASCCFVVVLNFPLPAMAEVTTAFLSTSASSTKQGYFAPSPQGHCNGLYGVYAAGGHQPKGPEQPKNLDTGTPLQSHVSPWGIVSARTGCTFQISLWKGSRQTLALPLPALLFYPWA